MFRTKHLILTLITIQLVFFSAQGRKISDQLDEFCQSEPNYGTNFVVRAFNDERKRYEQFNLPHTAVTGLSTGVLQNDYFKIVNQQSEEAIHFSCKTLRANTAFFLLNAIQDKFNEIAKYVPNVFDHAKFPITIRVNSDERWSIDEIFTGEARVNDAFMYCGYNISETVESEKYTGRHYTRVVERVRDPEIWFYKVVEKKSFLKIHPMCWGKSMSFCYQENAADTILSPGVVFHEYTHVLTDQYLNPCAGHVIKEAYSNYFGVRYSPTGKIGGKQRRELYPYAGSLGRLHFQHPGKYKERYDDSNKFKTVKNVKFATYILGEFATQMASKIKKGELNLSMLVIDGIVIKSMQFYGDLKKKYPEENMRLMMPALLSSASEVLAEQPRALSVVRAVLHQTSQEVFEEEPRQ